VPLPTHIGRYEVELLLGEGQNSRVLLARDPFLARQVAIKVARDDAEAVESRARTEAQLRRTAQALAGLSHPGLVALYDGGEDPSAGPFVVFELLRGETLRERLALGPLPPAEVARLARVIGAALAHAHSEGLVHGDVRAENIMLTPSGPKIARLGSSPDPKPAHAAPELQGGSPSPSSDQFALAATLSEALGEKNALRRSPRVEALFARALAREPRRRFQSCEAFAVALAAELETPMPWLLTSVRSTSIVPRATRRRQNVIAIAAVLVILGLLALGRLQRTARGGRGAAEGSPARGAASDFGEPIGDPRRAPPTTSIEGDAGAVAPARRLEGSPDR
jgi:serine/threonine protein kinase